MRVVNRGPDAAFFGMHFAEGVVVTVPDTVRPDKLAFIARQFEVVPDEPAPAEIHDNVEDPDDVIIPKPRRRAARR